MSETALQNSLKSVPKKLAVKIVKARKQEIGEWFQKADSLAEKELDTLISSAVTRIEKYFGGEIARLERLAQISEQKADIEKLESLGIKYKGIREALQSHCYLQLSALRLIVITPPEA